MKNTAVERIRELTAQLNKLRHEYYNLNAPTVSDSVYDRAYDELQRLENQTGFRMSNSPTQTVGYKAVDGLEKTIHSIPLLSLDKTKQTSDLTRFIGSQQVLLMHKLDGLTVKLEYGNGQLIRASTRGDGETGEVVTHNARAIEGIPAWIPYLQHLVIVGEVYITKPTFEKLRETLRDSSGNPYKNARNMAAGSIRCHDSNACVGRGLVFSPFSVLEGLDEDTGISTSKYEKLMVLERLGFSACRFLLLKPNPTERQITERIQRLRKIAEDKGLPIDGIVATYDNIPYSRSLGRTGHHYKDGLAFKFEDDLYETVLRGIEWTPSRTGELSPVALFDSVEIDGCEITRASLHNLTFIQDLELMPGCRILVSKRNMIIPHIEENLDRGEYDGFKLVPGECPCCGKPTRIQESRRSNNRVVRILRCDNAYCSNQRLRQFVHFVGKKAMDIEGLSEATLDKFISRGWLRDFTDIFRLNEHSKEIIGMEGFGEKSWRRLWTAIQRSRNTTFERYVISMDIPMIGRTASRELCRYFNGDLNTFETAVNSGFDFTQLNDFGEVLHRNIYDWFKIPQNKHLWKELQKMLNIQKSNTATSNTATSAATTVNPFNGKTVVATGKLDNYTRDGIQMKLLSLGAKPSGAVSRNTDFLIVGEKAGSKLDKAREFGVTTLTEAQFEAMIMGVAV